MTVNIVLTTIGANISHLDVLYSSDGINYTLLHSSVAKSNFAPPTGLNVTVPAGTIYIRVQSSLGVCDESIDLVIVQCTTTTTTTLASTTTTTTTIATPTTTTTTTAGDGPTTTTTTTLEQPPTTTTTTTAEEVPPTTTTTTTTEEVTTTTTTTTLLVEINCDEDMLMTFWSRQPAEANTWEVYIELPVPAPDTYIFRVSFSATRNDVPDTISSYLDVTISEGDYVGQKLDGTPAYHVANIVGEDWTVTSFEISSVTPDDGIFVYEACLTTTTTTTTIGD